MEPRPVRLVVSDDLDRSRLTVAFRLLLAIPHFFWLFLFSIGAFFVAIVGWIAALVRGSLPSALHGFLTAYVRYATHLFAYLSLAANPYPGFAGDQGYPIDLEVDSPRPQRRLAIAFRLVLAVPALLLTAVLTGISIGGGTGNSKEFTWSAGGTGIIWTVAVLAWFACLVRGRMPLGFRNLNAYGVRYGAETAAYTLLLTDRYPDVDPRVAPPAGDVPAHPVRVEVDDELRRTRLTVFFRLFLAIPHLVWLILWAVAAIFAAFANWIVTLVRGTSPSGLHGFLVAYVRYAAHVSAYLSLVTNPFPAFTGAHDYPLRVEIAPAERQSRWVTGFRGILAFPALIVSSALNTLLVAAAFLGWFAALVTGRMPRSLRNAGWYAVRYSAQAGAYAWLLTDRYPFSGPPAREEPAGIPVAAAP